MERDSISLSGKVDFKLNKTFYGFSDFEMTAKDFIHAGRAGSSLSELAEFLQNGSGISI